jgi:hypothetical protein
LKNDSAAFALLRSRYRTLPIEHFRGLSARLGCGRMSFSHRHWDKDAAGNRYNDGDGESVFPRVKDKSDTAVCRHGELALFSRQSAFNARVRVKQSHAAGGRVSSSNVFRLVAR